MQTIYNTSNLDQLTFLACDDATLSQFEKWIAGMVMGRDGEWGQDREKDGELIPGYLTWIKDHNASAAFAKNGLYQTFIWRDRISGEIVATGTIAPDDRGVKEEYKLGGDGLWGGVNVRYDIRYQGIGKYACACIDRRIAEFARSEGKTKLFHLFTANPAAEAIYEKLGFQRNPIGEIHTTAFGGERLWSKSYEVTPG